MNNPNELRLDVIRFKIIAKRYSQIRAVMAEHTGESDTALLRALRNGHGIEFDSLRQDPIIYIVISITYLRPKERMITQKIKPIEQAG